MTHQAKAVGYTQPLAIDQPDALTDVVLQVDEPTGRDVLVQVKAASVNPVDTKLRRNVAPPSPPRILGFDAAGVVVSVGDAVTRFAPGDDVSYAGVVNRSGSNAELQLVDEGLVGRKPASVDFAEAAAIPLTAITAWEALFERLRLTASSEGVMLVVAGAGGVGTMALQLARTLTDLTLIATASRPQSSQWAVDMGAHHVVPRVDSDEVKKLAPEGVVDFIISPYSSGNVEVYADILRPFGAVVALDDPEPPNLAALKPKSVTWHWESMFTSPLFEPGSDRQGRLLDDVAQLVDSGRVRSPLAHRLAPLSANTLTEAHRMVESSQTIGKIVIETSGR